MLNSVGPIHELIAHARALKRSSSRISGQPLQRTCGSFQAFGPSHFRLCANRCLNTFRQTFTYRQALNKAHSMKDGPTTSYMGPPSTETSRQWLRQVQLHRVQCDSPNGILILPYRYTKIDASSKGPHFIRTHSIPELQ